jgi:2-polyprenyl-6-methoxyphenol hydroxylase-like FAD-dependent oxidoreductase
MTVGADGIRSTVAALIRAPVIRQGRFRSAVLYRYITGVLADGYQWAYGNGAGAGLIPTNDGQTCVFVSTTPERMRGLRRYGAEHAFAELLVQAAPTLRDSVVTATPTAPIRGWGGVPGYLRRCWGAGWALVGDAGYFKDPITTHGMTDAMRDAELFAEAMLDATAGLPEAVALARYQAIRDRLSSQLFAATEDVAAYDWTTDRVQTLLRRVSSAMGDEVVHLQALPDRRLTAPAWTS